MAVKSATSQDARSQQAFCPQCGSGGTASDRFCRDCGTALAHGESPAPEAEGTAHPRNRRRAIVAGGLLALAAAAAAGAVIVSGTIASNADDEQRAEKRAEKRAAQVRSEKARAVAAGDFNELMRDRDRFFTAERSYRAALADGNRKVRAYRKEQAAYLADNKRIQEEFADEFDACSRYVDVECPDPTYPDAPEVPGISRETKRLRAAASDWEELRAQVVNASPPAELRTFHTQMLEAIDTLKANAEHNSDVFDEAVTEGEGGEEGSGNVDQGKLKTLRQTSGLPAIREMNRAALETVKRLQLPLADYDLRGGRDLDPSDSSNIA